MNYKKQLKNSKKGMHFYQAIEGFFILLLIGLALFSLFFLLKQQVSTPTDDLVHFRNKAIYTAQARTFAETPITISGKEETIHQALERYFYLDTKRNRQALTKDEIEEKTELLLSVQDLAEKIFERQKQENSNWKGIHATLIHTKTNYEVRVKLYPTSRGLSPTKYTINYPLYLESTGEQAGDYLLEIGVYVNE